jgi:hypothetical protein
MRINVSDIVVDPDLGGTTFMRRRPTVSLANYGLVSTSYETPGTTLAGIKQPAATADAQFLPEGTRLSDVEAFFVATSSLSAGDGKTTLPDLIVSGGLTYRVLHVQDFGNHGMVKALAERMAAA